MFIVVEKGTKTIVHRNMAPLSQKLSGTETYFQFNDSAHDLVLFDRAELPENWKIGIVNEDFYGTGAEDMNYVQPMNTQDKVDAEIITLEATEKVEDDAVVDKTWSEQVTDATISLADSKTQRLDQIKGLTYTTIVAEMPEWRQIRWNKYIDLHRLVLASSVEDLEAIDQTYYNNFPNSGETNATCYDDCLSALSWILQCISANDAKEEEIDLAVNAAGVIGVQDPTYPTWPL